MVVRVYRGALTFLGVYMLGSGISFGVHLYMARALGAASYGYFVYATNWMAVLLLACSLGLKPTTVRFVATYNVRGEWNLLRGYLRSATCWTIVASVIVTTIALVTLWIVRPRWDELGATLVLMAAAMPIVAIGEVWSFALRGFGAVARSQMPASIVQHLLLGFVLVMLIRANGASAGAALSAEAFLLATIGTLCAAGLLLYTKIPGDLAAWTPAYARSEWRQVAISNMLIALFQAVRAPLIVVIAGSYVDAPQLAYFGAAQRLANVMSLGLTGISAFVSPLISEYFALSDFTRLQRLAHAAARGAFAAALAAALLLIVLGRALLGLFGEGFGSAYLPLMVILIGEIAGAAAGPVGYFLTMTGRQISATRIEAVTSVLAIGIAMILVPRHGILGAAIVIATASTFRNVAMVVTVRRTLGLRSAIA